MGYCYDFGIALDGDDSAMMVSPEGGYCVCPSTGTTCAGLRPGCDQILSQPGRMSPSAPPAIASGGWWPASAAAPNRPRPIAGSIASPSPGTATPTDHRLGQIVEMLREMREQPSSDPRLTQILDILRVMAEPTEPPEPDPRVDRLMEMVQALATSPTRLGRIQEQVNQIVRSQEVMAAVPDTVTGTARAVEGIHEAVVPLLDLPARVESLYENLALLTEGVDLLRAEIRTDVAGTEQIAAVNRSIEQLARAIIELRRESAGDVRPSDGTHPVGESVENLAETVIAIRRELMAAHERQAGSIERLSAMVEGISDRLSAVEGVEAETADLSTAVYDMSAELAELRATSALPGVVTATELAETINTMRDSDVEEITLAHLVHGFRTELRDLRNTLTAATTATAGGTGAGPDEPGTEEPTIDLRDPAPIPGVVSSEIIPI